MFKSELLEMKMRETMTREKFLESMTSYQATLQNLIEVNNTREMTDKEKLLNLEKELQRHKALVESIETLELKYIEARTLIEKFEEVRFFMTVIALLANCFYRMNLNF